MSLPEGHWQTGRFLGIYGKTLAQLERYADAEAALVEAYEILEPARGAEHEWTISVIDSLVELYEAWDAAEPEQGYATKAAEWRAKLPEDATESLADKAAKEKEAASQPTAAETQPASQGATDPTGGGE
jgi:hypothetical protein